MTVHVSLDLETWGTRPGCDIRSIGAAVFDPARQWVSGYDDGYNEASPGTFYVACDNPAKGVMRTAETDEQFAKADKDGRYFKQTGYRYNLHRDPRTVQWWSEQSDEAQAAFADPVELKDALAAFTSWLYRIAGESGNSIAQRSDLRIWSHGAAFDSPILAAAYEAVGLPVPWHYRAPRDTRTLFDLADVTDHSAWLAQHPGPLGLTHHALDDAICQARAVCAAYKRIGQ